MLPTWTINLVSPLECIGESVPEHSYSYNQAGRLYESFRKKKRQHNKRAVPSAPDEHLAYQSSTGGSELGAVGGGVTDLNQDFNQNANLTSNLSRSRRHYQNDNNEEYLEDHDYHQSYEDPRLYGDLNLNHTNDHNFSASSHKVDRYGHLHANVEIVHPPQSHISGAGSPVIPSQSSNSAYKNQYNYLTKQDSDRSTRSVNADSGYSDGKRSRDGSYDLNDYTQRHHLDSSLLKHDFVPLHNVNTSPTGLDNSAFRYSDDELDVMDKRNIKPQSNVQYHSTSSKQTSGKSQLFLSPQKLTGLEEYHSNVHGLGNIQQQSHTDKRIAESFI